jgi:hypothetical protein
MQSINSGSAYRGSSPWGAANFFSNLHVFLFCPAFRPTASLARSISTLRKSGWISRSSNQSSATSARSAPHFLAPQTKRETTIGAHHAALYARAASRCRRTELCQSQPALEVGSRFISGNEGCAIYVAGLWRRRYEGTSAMCCGGAIRDQHAGTIQPAACGKGIPRGR